MPLHRPVGKSLPREVGDGLVMRRARLEDRERVAEFHANTLLDVGETPPLERLYAFVLDLMSGEHPTFTPGDFLVVEDTANGKIASSMCLISQTWSYEGIQFPAGQPDIVSTGPAYRRRGLVGAQMEEVHRWSAERGELVQGITGIPWFYRQYGYEYALSLDASRSGPRPRGHGLKEGETEPYRFRRATMDDVPFISEMYRQATSRSMVASVRDEALWRYDLEGRDPRSGIRREFRVMETPEGEPSGALIHSWKLWGGSMEAHVCEVKPGVPLLAAMPSMLRYMDATGEEYARRDGGEFTGLAFHLGEQ
ncbi:MAG: GNAT family N-acetyltransferase, partial [Chloroflexia bacterium]